MDIFSNLPVSVNDIAQARYRLRGKATVTPLIEYAVLKQDLGARVLIKFEGAQREGSFKFRGAFNRLVQLSPTARDAGVVAWSSGNHAQGVAAAARLLGIRATIVMPSDAPAVKLSNTRALGAEVVLYDRHTQSREDIARAIATERQATLVPSFEDRDIIAGQGTVGLELLEQAAAQGTAITQVLVPCGGGGLVAGVGLAVKTSQPSTKIFCVEPSGFDDHGRSLAAGRRVSNAQGLTSICDALLAPEPGELTFSINRHLLDGSLSVTDDEVKAAMRYAFRYLRLVVEPGGCVGLAAVLAGKVALASETTAIVISGSNVDPELFRAVIATPESLSDSPLA
jgi:threonine dehydratase